MKTKQEILSLLQSMAEKIQSIEGKECDIFQFSLDVWPADRESALQWCRDCIFSNDLRESDMKSFRSGLFTVFVPNQFLQTNEVETVQKMQKPADFLAEASA